MQNEVFSQMGKTLKRQFLPWLFLLPTVLGFIVFSWYPIVLGLIVSLQKYHPIRPPQFVGLANFETLFSDPLFVTAWKNTVEFSLLSLLIGYPVPVVLAILVNEVRRGKSFYRIAYYLPAVLPGVVTAVLWRWLYDPGVGLLNTVIRVFGGQGLPWLMSADTVIPSLVFMATWAGFGSTTVVYLAALQGVPSELYEAAEIDGALVLQRLRYITLPQIRPVMLTMLILQIIGTFQVFTEPFVMTSGGPNNASLTILLLIYRYAFMYFDFGVAAAAGFILFVVLLLVTLTYFRVTARLEE